MTLITEYRSAEAQLEELQARLKSLESDERLKKELEFEGMLRELMQEYSKSPSDLLPILFPQGVPGTAVKSSAAKATGSVRKLRALKQYLNPHTNEVVETKGGNHKVLKQWKQQYGAEVVEGWLK